MTRFRVASRAPIKMELIMGCSPVKNIVRLLLMLALTGATSCSPDGLGEGILKGHVDIGPLLPVSRAGVPEPTPSAEIYAAWQIVVFSENGIREIATSTIDSGGTYEISLPPGSYLVAGRPASGIGFLGQQKQPVELFKGEITQLDISIDTGIR
jgi:hypothetical protein